MMRDLVSSMYLWRSLQIFKKKCCCETKLFEEVIVKMRPSGQTSSEDNKITCAARKKKNLGKNCKIVLLYTGRERVNCCKVPLKFIKSIL